VSGIETSNSGWMKEWRALSLAVQFLTVLPWGRSVQVEPHSNFADQGRSLIWYPVVGLMLGGLLTGLSGLLPAPFYVTAALTVVLWAVVTGGLHLDGLADCADAWMGGLGDRDKTLRLLKDPLCGAMGVLSLVLVLLLKTAALAAMIFSGHWGWLWAVPLLSRLSLLLLFLSTPYVRPQGLGEVLAQYFPRPLARGVILLAISVCLWFLPMLLWGLWMLVAILVFAALRWAALKRLGGFTGDVAGAQVELIEVALLVVATVVYAG
jgi:adenosylcobinamide-GDP ribazoletransferase